jgi:hypothetical protein
MAHVPTLAGVKAYLRLVQPLADSTPLVAQAPAALISATQASSALDVGTVDTGKP